MSAQGWRDGGRRRAFTNLVVFGLAFALLSSCGSRGPSEGKAVARINDRLVTLEEFEQQLGEASQQDESLRITRAGKQELLDRLVQKELLIQEARRQGLDRPGQDRGEGDPMTRKQGAVDRRRVYFIKAGLPAAQDQLRGGEPPPSLPARTQGQLIGGTSIPTISDDGCLVAVEGLQPVTATSALFVRRAPL